MLGFKKDRERTYLTGRIDLSDKAMEQRLRFQGLTERDLGVIVTWRDACQGMMDLLVDRFYDHIKANPVTLEFLNEHTTVEKQRPMLTHYVETMMQGVLDDQYVEYRRRATQ
jgi:hypothetical protein